MKLFSSDYYFPASMNWKLIFELVYGVIGIYFLMIDYYHKYKNVYVYVFLFNFRVSKGVRDIPGSFQSSTINVPSGQSFVYFGILLAAGVFFVFIAFTMFLPVMVLVPQKFAICFTIGCALIVASFFALKGPKNQLAHMISKEVFYFISLTNARTS